MASTRLVWRFLHAVAALLGVSIVAFAVEYAAGEPSTLLVSAGISDLARLQTRVHLGLDQPVVAQYLLFLRHALQGDFGQSSTFRQAVATVVLQHLPPTILLAGSGLALAVVVGVPLAVVAASRGGWAALLLQGFSTIGLAIPSFWLGLMLVLGVSVRLRLLPADGYGGIAHLVLPAMTLGLPALARMTRRIEPIMREVMRTDYICAARARGLLERRVIWVHGLRNLLAPVAAMAAAQLCELVSAAVAVEVVFAWPGIGQLAATALWQHDFPLLQGIVFIAGLGFVLINLVTDIMCGRLDPRGAPA